MHFFQKKTNKNLTYMPVTKKNAFFVFLRHIYIAADLEYKSTFQIYIPLIFTN